MPSVNEREKLIAGEPYDASDPELLELRRRARAAMDRFNATLEDGARMEIAAELLGSLGAEAHIERPFFCDYGFAIHIGIDTFINTNCVFLDGATISIGDHVNIASGVQLITADHPREPELRLQDVEFSRPVSIGSGAWIGAGAIVCPGVGVGEGAIVGAGSVVVKDVPARVVAAGNPCRVIREL